jgi:outer membrane protein assembly factor BamD
MKRSFIIVALLAISFSVSVLIQGCAGKTESETLSGDSLTSELKELYDAEALLKKADKLFKEKDFAGAIPEYRRFLELHPYHKSAAHAQYRIGLSYFKQIRSIDRDIEPVQKALSAFETVLKDYSMSEFVNDSSDKIKVCREKLAEREFYVGNFYLKKEDYPAAVERFRIILTEYPDSAVSEKAFYHLGIAYSSNGKIDKAVEVLQDLLTRYPDSRYKEDAAELLATLNGHQGF